MLALRRNPNVRREQGPRLRTSAEFKFFSQSKGTANTQMQRNMPARLLTSDNCNQISKSAPATAKIRITVQLCLLGKLARLPPTSNLCIQFYGSGHAPCSCGFIQIFGINATRLQRSLSNISYFSNQFFCHIFLSARLQNRGCTFCKQECRLRECEKNEFLPCFARSAMYQAFARKNFFARRVFLIEA